MKVKFSIKIFFFLIQYYRLFISWTNEKIKRTFVERNMFDFKHIRPFEQSFIDSPGPMVLFSTPGMYMW